MLKVEKADVYGWECAIRGMRNPMNSWDKSDTDYHKMLFHYYGDGITESTVSPEIGANDLDLMKRLVKAGSDHSKFMRMITVTLDITAPLYWWKEWDTYKIGTVANSCSTMHKVHEKEFTLDDFSHEHLDSFGITNLNLLIRFFNFNRDAFVQTQNKENWWQLIQLLPTSYNQKRTVQLNYAVLRNMYHARKNHKLDEWLTFCKWVKKLPYSELITK